MRRTNEGGSVLGFVVVAVVLAGLLVGGAYFVNRQLTEAPAPVVEQQDTQTDKKDKKQTPPPAEPGNKHKDTTPESTPRAGVAHELPATGPKEAIGTMLVIGLLSGVLVGYVRSRRPRFSL